MRITPLLLKSHKPKSEKARYIPKEPIAFQEILPLKLKAGVSGKGTKMSDVCCIHEMSVMFACFKENDFQQSLCGKEIESFQKCYMSNLQDKAQKKERDLKGILTPGDKNFTPKQVNMLLRKFPNI